MVPLRGGPTGLLVEFGGSSLCNAGFFFAKSLLQPYGRNWSFLWSVAIPKWHIFILVVVFFVVVWGILLWVLTYFSKTHTWLLPVFAVGLGAPRWAQVCDIQSSFLHEC